MESTMTISENGVQKCYKNGKMHRTDGPALIYPDGSEIWCQNDKLHRKDGPAIIFQNGTKKWYRNGKLHCTDGPAVIWANGRVQWWLNDKNYSFQEWADALNLDQKTQIELVMKWNPQ